MQTFHLSLAEVFAACDPAELRRIQSEALAAGESAIAEKAARALEAKEST